MIIAEDLKPNDSHYDTRKILGETRYNQKSQNSTRSYMQAYDTVNKYKEQMNAN